MAETEAVRALIARWQDAFRFANGKEAPVVDYDRGWYYVDGRTNPLAYKWRAKQLEEATERLRARPLPRSEP